MERNYNILENDGVYVLPPKPKPIPPKPIDPKLIIKFKADGKDLKTVNINLKRLNKAQITQKEWDAVGSPKNLLDKPTYDTSLIDQVNKSKKYDRELEKRNNERFNKAYEDVLNKVNYGNASMDDIQPLIDRAENEYQIKRANALKEMVERRK